MREREKGGEEESARCRCPVFPIRTKSDVHRPRKIRGAGYESRLYARVYG